MGRLNGTSECMYSNTTNLRNVHMHELIGHHYLNIHSIPDWSRG